jgi:7-cyano-7-deazaguanine reductase
VELKSLKLYLQRFRDQGIFYENVINRLLDDFVKAVQPRRLKVVGAFTPRGGISTTVTCVYEAEKG